MYPLLVSLYGRWSVRPFPSHLLHFTGTALTGLGDCAAGSQAPLLTAPSRRMHWLACGSAPAARRSLRAPAHSTSLPQLLLCSGAECGHGHTCTQLPLHRPGEASTLPLLSRHGRPHAMPWWPTRGAWRACPVRCPARPHASPRLCTGLARMHVMHPPPQVADAGTLGPRRCVCGVSLGPSRTPCTRACLDAAALQVPLLPS
jgi:hypothetical protein